MTLAFLTLVYLLTMVWFVTTLASHPRRRHPRPPMPVAQAEDEAA